LSPQSAYSETGSGALLLQYAQSICGRAFADSQGFYCPCYRSWAYGHQWGEPILPELAHPVGMVARNLSHIEVAIDFDEVSHSAAFDF